MDSGNGAMLCRRLSAAKPALAPREHRKHRERVMDNNGTTLKPRSVKESEGEMTELVLPNDANPLGALLGGRLMHWIDIAGALAAHRHSRSYVVTASIDKLDFLVPVHVGDIVIFKSSVNRAFSTSMESGVKVFVENYATGERRHVSSAYLTFVAVDRHGRKHNVPPIAPETPEEKRRYEEAGRRREMRHIEATRKKALL